MRGRKPSFKERSLLNDELQIMHTAVVPYDANEFTGKRILVTGGSKGIGGAIVMMVRRRSVNSQI
jgi:hypothetical protein